MRWRRSVDGYCKSADGRWHIVPLYCGCVRPRFYELRDIRTGRAVSGMHATQREAKEDAAWRSTRSRAGIPRLNTPLTRSRYSG